MFKTQTHPKIFDYTETISFALYIIKICLLFTEIKIISIDKKRIVYTYIYIYIYIYIHVELICALH